MRKVFQLLAFGGIDDADAFERNVQFLRRFLNLRAITQKNRRAEPERIELPRRLQDARLSPFRENDPFRVALELFNDAANKTHGKGVLERDANSKRLRTALDIERVI
jgi:hypothetical protein